MGECARNGLYIGAGSGAVAGTIISGNPFVLAAAQGALGYWIGNEAENSVCAEDGDDEPTRPGVATAAAPAAPGAAPEPPQAVVYLGEQAAPEQDRPQLDFSTMSKAELDRQAETFFTGVYVTVKFDYNTAILDPPTVRRISEVAEFMKYYPGSRVHVIGHTDGIGTESYNMNLSLQRAAGVANELVERGIPVDRIEIEGRGESEPIADNETELGRAANRRVDITVRPSASEPVPPEPLPPTPAPDPGSAGD